VSDLSVYGTGEDGSAAVVEIQVIHLDSTAADATIVEMTLSDVSEARIQTVVSTPSAGVSWSVSSAGDVLTVELTSSANVSVTLEGVDDVIDDGDIAYTIDVQTGTRLTSMSSLGSAGDIHPSLSFTLQGLNTDNDTTGTAAAGRSRDCLIMYDVQE
jgi:hypothetical protein